MLPLRLLLGPGPSEVHPCVLQALAQPTIGHLDPAYLQLMNELQERLRQAFRTANELTFAVSGTGSAGMECAVANLVEPGTPVVVGVNGVFGGRMAEVAERCGGQVVRIERAWGDVFTLDDVSQALERHRPRVVCLVMAETSTGAWQPLEAIARRVRESGALLVVDAVTALGGVPLEVDAWGLDVVYSGAQKCLSCPPGLAPITFGPRAVEAIHARKSKMASWYFDVSLLSQYWGSDRVYHHTAPINMTYALHEALRLVLDEGLEAAWQRHELAHRALKAGLAALGIGYASDPQHTLPQLNAVWTPPGVDDVDARRRLLDECGIEIGGGLGQYRGRVWRIGLMGHGARRASVYRFLAALEELLPRYGVRFDAGAGTAAAAGVFRDGLTPSAPASR